MQFFRPEHKLRIFVGLVATVLVATSFSARDSPPQSTEITTANPAQLSTEPDLSPVDRLTSLVPIREPIKDVGWDTWLPEDEIAQAVEREEFFQWVLAVEFAVAEEQRIEQERQAAIVAEQQRQAERQRQVEAQRQASMPAASVPAQYGTGACGGDLPPCAVMMCESGGSITAQNPNSTASGKWQFLDSTWGGYGGYSEAWMAPEHIQDERARQVYAGGRGRSQWMC